MKISKTAMRAHWLQEAEISRRRAKRFARSPWPHEAKPEWRAAHAYVDNARHAEDWTDEA